MKTSLIYLILISAFAFADGGPNVEVKPVSTKFGQCQVTTFGAITSFDNQCQIPGYVMIGITTDNPPHPICSQLQVSCDRSKEAMGGENP